MKTWLILFFLMSPAFAADLAIPRKVIPRPHFAPLIRVPLPKRKPWHADRPVPYLPSDAATWDGRTTMLPPIAPVTNVDRPAGMP